jgi:hypothetical protein
VVGGSGVDHPVGDGRGGELHGAEGVDEVLWIPLP